MTRPTIEQLDALQHFYSAEMTKPENERTSAFEDLYTQLPNVTDEQIRLVRALVRTGDRLIRQSNQIRGREPSPVLVERSSSC